MENINSNAANQPNNCAFIIYYETYFVLYSLLNNNNIIKEMQILWSKNESTLFRMKQAVPT